MATLETQYNSFLHENPNSNFSFSEWKEWQGNQIKKELANIMKADEELGLYDKPKQETLEEFAERLCPNKQNEYDMIIEGGKWQQEQIGKSEFLQKLRATLSDAEARRLINI
jgi:hypothetical protein